MSAAIDALATNESWDDEGIPGVDALHLEKRYGEERAKRLRDDGDSQFIDVSLSEQFKSFLKDPWVDDAKVKAIGSMFPGGGCKMIILGAGWGGLLYAIRMVEAGIAPADIRIVEEPGTGIVTLDWHAT
jgi:hypothetical protein